MDDATYEASLRRALDVQEDTSAEAILELIEKEGWQPNLISTEIEGKEVWACPVSNGIFQTVEIDPKARRKGHAGSLSREIAVLEGLRKARGWPLMKKQIEQFDVVTEDGGRDTVFVYVDMIDASTFQEPGKVIESKLRECRTVDGHFVNVLPDGSFEILYPLGNKKANRKE